MNPNSRKLQHRAEQEHALEQQTHSAEKMTAREFATAEELLRHDAAQTVVPIEVAARLRESIAREPTPQKGWWQRLFSR